MNRREGFIWLAGFIEGEGCFSAARARGPGSRFTRVRLTITQVRIEPLLRVQKLLGGSISRPIKPRGLQRQAYYQYYCGWNDLEQFLPRFVPYLLPPKRDQLQQAIDRVNLDMR